MRPATTEGAERERLDIQTNIVTQIILKIFELGFLNISNTESNQKLHSQVSLLLEEMQDESNETIYDAK